MQRVRALTKTEADALRKRLRLFHVKYAAIFGIGLDSGLRVSDILRINVSDINDDGSGCVIERKTGKQKSFCLSKETLADIDILTRRSWSFSSRPVGYLIPRVGDKRDKPLSRQQVYNRFKKASRELGLENVATHSMRKTYARSIYTASRDLDGTRAALNHHSTATTVGYLVDL